MTLHPLYSIHAHKTLYVLSIDRLEDRDAQMSYRTMLMHTRMSMIRSKKELTERDGAKRQAEGRGAQGDSIIGRSYTRDLFLSKYKFIEIDSEIRA